MTNKQYEAMMTMFSGVIQSVEGLRKEVGLLGKEVKQLRGEFNQLRGEFDQLREEFYEFRQETREEFASVRRAIATLDAKVDNNFAYQSSLVETIQAGTGELVDRIERSHMATKRQYDKWLGVIEAHMGIV